MTNEPLTIAEIHSRITEALDLLYSLHGRMPNEIDATAAFKLGQASGILSKVRYILEQTNVSS